MDLSLREICGQLLVVGFDGHALPQELAEALANRQRGGVILFKRNLPNLEVAHELGSRVLDVCADELPPFIGVDEEGGRVRRLPTPALVLPPMRKVGQHGDPEFARRVGTVLGKELSALGFNLDFAPVLDVDSNPKNPIIGDRAFSDDPNQVARMARAFARGLKDAGVLACGKHFPGHGDTDRDSHLDLPVVRHDRKRLDAVELPPFRAASHAGLPALMTAHVVYEGLDPGVTATLSHKISTQLLRTELGFGGVLFSDDLEMKAVADRYPIDKIAVGAIAAGCDALLVCKDAELAAQAHDALTERAEHDDAFAARCRQALGRCLSARRQHPPRPVPDFDEVTALLEGPEVTALKAELDALE